MNRKSTIWVIVALSFVICITIKWVYDWENPPINTSNILCLQECVYTDPRAKKEILNSMGNIFEVNFIENSAKECFNPFFPIIHIKLSAKHNAWIHIIHTDAREEYLKLFIDTDQEFTPFYNFEDNFYDAPYWNYRIFDKPLSFWEGHAYAVDVDHAAKIMTILGGVRWGFRFGYFSLKPNMIFPSELSKEEWQQDWLFFSKSLINYTYKFSD